MKTKIRVCLMCAVLARLASVAVDARVVVRGGLTDERNVSIGETYFGEVIVENVGDQAAAVKVYQTDYTFDATGSSYYDEVGSVDRSNGTWVSFTTPRIELGPGAHAVVDYTVRVPERPDLEGTFWSLLMIESIPANSPELPGGADEPSLGIQTNVRYAIQVVTHIGDSGREDFRLSSITLRAQDAEHLGVLEVDLENIGQRMIRAELRVELFDRLGENAGMFFADRVRSYPSTSVRYEADLTKVPTGAYKMMLMVRLSSGSVYASEYELGS